MSVWQWSIARGAGRVAAAHLAWLPDGLLQPVELSVSNRISAGRRIEGRRLSNCSQRHRLLHRNQPRLSNDLWGQLDHRPADRDVRNCFNRCLKLLKTNVCQVLFYRTKFFQKHFDKNIAYPQGFERGKSYTYSWKSFAGVARKLNLLCTFFTL